MQATWALCGLMLLSSVACLEFFSSTGKYDYGSGGVLLPGVEVTLIEQAGPGLINSFQFASDFDGYEETVFRFYYDGETTPYSTAKLFQGIWHSAEYIFGSNGKSSFYITAQFPFKESVKITAEMESVIKDPQLAYWSIRGIKGMRVTIGQFTLPQEARLKIQETELTVLYPLESLSLASAEQGDQEGLLYACQMEFTSVSFDYLEGRITLTTNGEDHFLATGLDDYFGSAWWFTGGRGTYAQPGSKGLMLLKEPGKIAAHRIHERDLVPWKNSFDLRFRNGDQSFDGELLGAPDITQCTARVWLYQWPTQ